MADNPAQRLRIVMESAGLDLPDAELERLLPLYDIWRRRLDEHLHSVDTTGDEPTASPPSGLRA